MEYHQFILDPSRTLSAANRMEVFGGGTDPAGLGTLGAPVNPAHVFEYLGENLPPFGNPKDFVGQGGRRWSQEAERVYGGRYISEKQDRFSPNTTTLEVEDSEPLVIKADEISEVKNNAQIVLERTKNIGSLRVFGALPTADLLAAQVNADAEARNIQNQAVSLAYESQMDAIRATHLAAKARGVALRGEDARPFFKALKPLRPTVTAQPKAQVTATLPSTQVTLPATSGGAQPVLLTPVSSSAVSTPTTVIDAVNMATPGERHFEPTQVAAILGGVAVVALAAFFFMRK